MNVARYPGVYRLWRAVRLSRGGRVLAGAWGRRITRARLARHAEAVDAADPSYAGEWPHLRDLLGRLELLRGGFAVDLAAGDGASSSCTLPLFRDHAWSGLAVECDPVRFSLLAHAYRRFPRVRLASERVTPGNVNEILERNGVPTGFSVLNLDLDSYDLAVASSILRVFRPLVIDLEVNEKVPPPVRFAVRYTPEFRWDEGHCYGCSLSAACDVLGAAGYRLEALEYNNAFFVRADLAVLHGVPDVDPEVAYRRGYREREDRCRHFPWNLDMEELLGMDPAEVVARLDQRFRRVPADYALQLEPLRPDWSEPSGAAP